MILSDSCRLTAAVIALLSGVNAQQQGPRQFDSLAGEDLPFVQAGVIDPVVADLDGDGLSDLFYAGQVRTLLLGSADTSFRDASERIPIRSGLRDRDAIAVDYDADGDLDLAIAVQGRDSILLRNDGAAGFVDVSLTQPWGRLFPPPQTTLVQAGDLDGDGLPELLFAGPDREDRIYLGQAGGFATCSACQPAPLVGTRAALFADFDGDGDLDLLRLAESGSGGTVGLFETNDGQSRFTVVQGAVPTFGAEVLGAAVADYDRDGDVDVLAFNAISSLIVYRNDGSGTFALAGQPAIRLPAPRSMAVADRDGDGFVDLALAGDEGVEIFEVNKLGLFLPAGLPDRTRQPAFAAGWVDANGDGVLDVAAYQDGSVQLWLELGFDFYGLRTAELGAVRGAVALGDFDLDGDLDALIGGNGQGRGVAHVATNSGDGRFTNLDPLASPANGQAPAIDALLVADLTGDGDLDAIVGQGSGQPLYYRGQAGSANFSLLPRSFLPLISTPQAAIIAGDVDGDLDLDVAIVGNAVGGTGTAVQLLLNQGAGVFVEAPAGSLPRLPERAGDAEFADTDGDGDLDLLVCISNRTVGTQLLHWRNDGAGMFAPATPPPGTPGYDTSVTVADFDGDGDADVATGQSLLRNDGTGLFMDVTAQLVDAPLGVAPAFVDVDLDGDLDLLTLRAFFRQQADGSFQLDESIAGDRAPRVYDVGDVDGDGDPDIAGSYVLQRNLQTEIEVLSRPRIGGSLPIAVYSKPGAGVFGQVAVVWVGAQRSAVPVVFPDIGSFRLDATEIAVTALVLLGSDGRGEVSVAVPDRGSLVGADVHTQALILGATIADWRLTRAETVQILR